MKMEKSKGKTFIAAAVTCGLLLFGAVAAAYDPTEASRSMPWDRIESKTDSAIILAADAEKIRTPSATPGGGPDCNWNGDYVISSKVLGLTGPACSGCCSTPGGHCWGENQMNSCRLEAIEQIIARCIDGKLTFRKEEGLGKCACAGTCHGP